MSTLFSFVTVRNPRTPTGQELTTGFVRYDPVVKSPVVEGLVAARAKGGDATRELLAKTARTKRAWTDEAAMADTIPELLAFARWLSFNADTLTWKDVEAARKLHPIGSTAEALPLLWDNLALQTYASGPPEIRELVVWALRAIHLLAWDGPREDDLTARRLATATPLFPSAAHGPVDLDRTTGGGGPDGPDGGADGGADGGTETEGQAAGRKRLAALDRAHAGLTRELKAARDRTRGSAVTPPYVPAPGADGCVDLPETGVAGDIEPQRLTIDESLLKRLDPDARAVLGDLGIEAGHALTFALARIVDESQALGTEVAMQSRGAQRVTRVGGALWMRGEPARSTGEPAAYQMLDERTQATYSRFWGDSKDIADHYERNGCRVRPLGIGDFRRVEQTLCCNVPGEIAHIENVLKGETKERTTSHRTTVETFTSVVSEEDKTTERDSQTTDRFEMEKEVAKAIESDLSFQIGVNVAAQYGPVKLTADTKFATSLSSKESDKQATKYAKEVTDKTLERVVTKVREERSTRSIEEFIETNLHRLQAVDSHVVGLYRWVEKIYTAKVVNYGKRLMFEFLIPEPAAFHLHAMAEHAGDADIGISKPVDPRSQDTQTAFGRPPLQAHTDITETNYAFWAATYDAVVDPPPAVRVTTSKSYSRSDMDHNVQFADSKTDLAMPAGYEAANFNAVYGLHSEVHDGGPNWVTVVVGRRSKFDTQGGGFSGLLDGEDDVVPVTLMGRTRFYGVSLEVECTRTDHAYVTWQEKTFRAVMDGYAAKLGAYQTALAEARTGAGVQIQGSNPLFNRQTEQVELEKGAIRLLTGCVHLPSEAMHDGGECGYPEFDCCEAMRDGTVVEFFEQLFEWRLMTYVFYPYFWGRKCKWTEIYRLDDVDPMFMAFLKAGFARVVVPVRPGYEHAALRFLADGRIWDGGSAPGIDDPMYVAIENELKQPVSEVDPTIEPWEIRIPTTLTVLQCESGCTPGTGLPCPCEEVGGDHGHGGGVGG